jgi:hypothetical protein
MAYRQCPQCETRTSADFCPSCGRYLRWEPTSAIAVEDLRRTEPETPNRDTPLDPRTIDRQADQPLPRAPALITLRDPATDARAGAGLELAIEPGRTVTIIATAHNQGDLVDSFDLAVRGMPDDWWSIEPEAVFLVPPESPGASAREAEVSLHPPRSADAEARVWPIEVIAHSRARETIVATAPVAIEILPYRELALTVRPERSAGRRRGRFDISVSNPANAHANVELSAADAEDRCPLKLRPDRLNVPPGGTETARLLARVPRRMLVGRPVDHALDVRCLPAGAQDGPEQRVTFVQRPWLPWWVPPVALMLLAVAIALYFLLGRNPTVPDVQGMSFERATAVLAQKGFAVAEPRTRDVDADDVGRIVRQVPAADAGAEEGSAVELWVGVARRTAAVPRLRGRSVAEARGVLEKRGFQLGRVDPIEAADEWRVVGQEPRRNEVANVGTPVDLKAEPRPAERPEPKGNSGGAGGRGGGAPGGGAGATLPADLAFSSGGQVFVRPAQAKEPNALNSSDRPLFDPTWAPDGTLIALELRGDNRRLVTLDPAKPAVVRPLTGPARYHRPAVSPDGATLAVIVASDEAGAGALCGIALPVQSAETCSPPPEAGWTVGRPAWSPDGDDVAVLAHEQGPGHYTAVVIYHVTGADPGEWEPQGSRYEAASLEAVTWLDDERLAVTAAPDADANALPMLLTYEAGALAEDRSLGTTAGCDLAGFGGMLAMSTGNCDADGPVVLFDVDDDTPPSTIVDQGSDPAWRAPR